MQIIIPAPKATFLLFSMQRRACGLRHPLLLRKLIATTISEMLGAGCVNDLTF